MKDFKDMKTSEMVVEFNALTGEQVKKFADRASAERRLTKARKDFPEAAESYCAEVAEAEKTKYPVENQKQFFQEKDGSYHCPKCGSEEVFQGRGKNGIVVEEETFYGCHHCDWEFDALNQPKNINRSKSTSESWNNAEIAEKRKQRNAVAVEDHGVYRSVKHAFEALGLNKSKHIKFRLDLKKMIKLTYVENEVEYVFSLATISKEAKSKKQTELPLQ